MAARLNRRHQDMVRDKIRASQLINRVEACALGEIEMTPVQLSAALGLLKKCVPDLSATEVTADVNSTTTVITQSAETILNKLRVSDDPAQAVTH
jgi:hypothetical protein